MTRPQTVSEIVSRWSLAAYALAIFAVGVIYRATFLDQGFNPTDEGWLQSMGARVVAGQVPYRDFYFGLPPLSIYEQAALIKLMGSSYGILASRWVFNVEVSLASVVAFLIVSHYVRPRIAFLAVLPTCFFTVILFYFSNYSYDGELLALASLGLLVYSSGRWPLAVVAGVFGAAAFMAKPTFLGLLPVVVIAATANWAAARRGGAPLRGATTSWRFAALYCAGFLGGSLAVLAYFGVERDAYQFLDRAFLMPRQTYPLPLTFVIWQDLPEWLLVWPNVTGYIAAAAVAVLLLRVDRVPDLARLALFAVLVAVLVVRALPAAVDGVATPRQNTLLLFAIATLWILNLAGIAAAVLARGDLRERLFPPELPVMALGLQYVAQFNAAGIRFSYYGAFLSVPVALLFVQSLAGVALPVWRRGAFAAAPPRQAAALLGVAIALAGVVVTHGLVNRDGPRSQLTAEFHTPLLRGVYSVTANTQTIDDVVTAVDARSQPGDPIFVMPDYPCLYFLTGRRNPTPVGWYEAPQVAASQSSEIVLSLEHDPPKVVVLQTYDAADLMHRGPPLDYLGIPQWRPIYEYVIDHYTPVETLPGGLVLYVPNKG